jgi:D-alanyl-D-alanine dipeptidase
LKARERETKSAKRAKGTEKGFLPLFALLALFVSAFTSILKGSIPARSQHLFLSPVGVAQEMPREKGNFRKSELVELIKLDPTIKLDIRYATSNNFLGRPVYKEARAFLQRPAAEALLRAHRKLRERGYGLLVFDGYRPWSVTKLFWDSTPQDKKQFVANPSQGSRHNRGCAVDLTLYDLRTGEEVEMPSGYDEFSDRAYPNYSGGTQEQRRMREMLREAMEAQGFTVYEFEWWHYDYKDWKKYPILDISFDQIKTASARRGR